MLGWVGGSKAAFVASVPGVGGFSHLVNAEKPESRWKNFKKGQVESGEQRCRG